MRAIPVVVAWCIITLLAYADTPTADQVLVPAKAKASAEHKAIFVHFGASWCGWCKRLDAFLDQQEIKPVFEKYFVPVKLVVQENEKNKALENPGAEALLRKLGGPSGLPYSAFLDSKGKLIVNSMSDGGNIGYPAQPAEIDWFIQMMRKAAPNMSQDDLKTIETALRSFKRLDANADAGPMRLLITSDLHQLIAKWTGLVASVAAERPRFVLIAGDLLPKEAFSDQKAFFGDLRRSFREMKRFGPVTILTYLGNDDAHVLEPLLDDLQAERLCINLNGQVHREAGLVFCGMNRVRDYPFGYKHWCAPDGQYVACPQQYCGQGLTMDARGNYVRLANLVEYLKAKPSIANELDQLKEQLRAGEMEHSIWMVHQPPTGLGMDILEDGQQVGSPTVLKFIQQNQPLLGCSGHIHESPYQPGGQWLARVGRSLWVQPGQMEYRLHYVGLTITRGLSVTNIKHSVFGQDNACRGHPALG